MIITPAYYESVFCNCELGGSWLTAKDAPLLIKPIDYGKLKGVLYGVHCGKIEDESDLNDLYDRLKDAGIVNPSVARWEMRRDAFLQKLPDLLKALVQSTAVPVEEHNKLKDKYDAALKVSVDNEKEIEKLKKQFDDLAAKKDTADVIAAKMIGSTEPDQFATLTKSFVEARKRLLPIAVRALYPSAGTRVTSCLTGTAMSIFTNRPRKQQSESS